MSFSSNQIKSFIISGVEYVKFGAHGWLDNGVWMIQNTFLLLNKHIHLNYRSFCIIVLWWDCELIFSYDLFAVFLI